MTHTIVVNEPTERGQRHFGVVFADGTRMDYSVSSVEELKRRIRADAALLDEASDLAKVPTGELDTAQPAPMPPTQFELDLAAYFKHVNVLTQLKVAFKDTDQQVIDQALLVKTLYRSEYYDET